MAYVPRHRRTPDTNHASSPVGPRTLEQLSMETGALGTRPLRGAAQARSSRSALLRCAACSKAKESFDFDPNQLTRGESRQCFECLVGGTWALAEENRHRRLDISTPGGRQVALAAYQGYASQLRRAGMDRPPRARHFHQSRWLESIFCGCLLYIHRVANSSVLGAGCQISLQVSTQRHVPSALLVHPPQNSFVLKDIYGVW